MASVLKKAGKGLVDKTKAHELNMAVLKRIDPETEEVGYGLIIETCWSTPWGSWTCTMALCAAGGVKSGQATPRTPSLHGSQAAQIYCMLTCRMQILASSGQVCLYKMSVEDQQWVSVLDAQVRHTDRLSLLAHALPMAAHSACQFSINLNTHTTAPGIMLRHAATKKHRGGQQRQQQRERRQQHHIVLRTQCLAAAVFSWPSLSQQVFCVHCSGLMGVHVLYAHGADCWLPGVVTAIRDRPLVTMLAYRCVYLHDSTGVCTHIRIPFSFAVCSCTHNSLCTLQPLFRAPCFSSSAAQPPGSRWWCSISSAQVPPASSRCSNQRWHVFAAQSNFLSSHGLRNS